MTEVEKSEEEAREKGERRSESEGRRGMRGRHVRLLDGRERWHINEL